MKTFVLYEILAVEAQGLRVELYPLQRERAARTQPEATPIVERAHFSPLLSAGIAASHVHFLLRRPLAYLAALGALLRHNAGSPRYLAGAIAFFPKAVHWARRMQRDGVTHVHAHFASHPAAVAFVVHRLTGIPYSFTAHGSDLHRDRHMLREKVAEAAFVVAISQYNRDVILAECEGSDAEKVVVIHCGVDGEVFRPVPPVSRDDESVRLLSTGTLHAVKGQSVLLEACRLLRERGVPFRCDLVGDGPDRRLLERQARRSEIEDAVHFHGARTRAEVVEHLREADVFAAPSVPTSDGRREGIPVALMEAAACGRPAVASRLSGIPELVVDGETGILVPPGDAGALADAIERLAADPAARERMGRAARARVMREFELVSSARELARRFTAEARS
jgi:glycosyltransferase involved in cell wall biosynthesis